MLTSVCMGYIFDTEDARRYEEWMADEKNRAALDLEMRLMTSMLRPVCGESLLDIGCGTGESIKPYLGKGINLTGIDPSGAMLAIAKEKLGHRVDFHRGFAEDLPFSDNAFNHASLFLTLEFSKNPYEAIAEACRVAKDSVFIGILNRHSAYTTQLRVRAFFTTSIYSQARFFSIGEVKEMIFRRLGPVPVIWKTALQFPGSTRGPCYRLEAGGYLEKNPFGAFAGIKAIPVPRFQAMPLALKTRAEIKAAAGNRVASCRRYNGEAAGAQSGGSPEKRSSNR